MKSFYVINHDFSSGKLEHYDIMPYLISQYKESKNKKLIKKDVKDFIIAESMYKWWSRCEYEIIISDWPSQKTHHKIDIHYQVMMNLDTIVNIFIDNISKLK